VFFLVYGRSFTVLAVPLVGYIIAFVLAVLQVVVSGEPNGNFFGIETIKIAVSYYAITICMNIALTILICSRLLRWSRRISTVLGEENARGYTSAAAILVESAALYTVSGITYLIPYALQLDVGILFGQLWTKMSVISPLLIILRVVHGRDWKDPVVTETPLEFATTSIAASSTQVSHIHLEDFDSAKIV